MTTPISKLSEDFRKGQLTRRQFITRVTATTGSAFAASHALSLMGFDNELVQEVRAHRAGIIESSGQYPHGTAAVDYFMGRPKYRGRFPAMIVIHENMDLTDFTRNVARLFARQGFVALAPSVLKFSRPAPTPSPSPSPSATPTPTPTPAATPEATPAPMVDLSQGKHAEWMLATLETGVADIPPDEIDALNSGYQFLANRPDVDPMHIASTGFCWGGARSFSLATRNQNLWAAIVFYGSTPPFDQLQYITAPVLGLYGALDNRSPTSITGRAPETAREMARLNKVFEWEIYNQAGHGFFRGPDRIAISEERPAKLAWRLLLDFLSRHYERK
jgi:carboxymethylenebutenolidase